MADREKLDCPCSNIAIMQLFHEFKQKYPSVPDQIVSKIIQENCHDKKTCDAILMRENHVHLPTYPRVLTTGNSKETPEERPSCNKCPELKVINSKSVNLNTSNKNEVREKDKGLTVPDECGIYLKKMDFDDVRLFDKSCIKKGSKRRSEVPSEEEMLQSVTPGVDTGRPHLEKSISECKEMVNEKKEFGNTSLADCQSESKSGLLDRSQSCDIEKSSKYSKVEAVRWSKGSEPLAGSFSTCSVSGGHNSVNNYQVAVQYYVQPEVSARKGDQQRSFTSVNLCLRPPSSEPQVPIEIQSGRNLVYTTSMFDDKVGVQPHFQITISPVLLEKQRERKNLLGRELRKEQDKLRHMKNEVRLMKASINQKPNLQILPKLKAEIDRLRAECKKLTAEVDLYSDVQNILPLGETDEEFYRNIYTGQTLQRETSWSCQLCTFRNHPLLNVCEECEMPRISLGTQVMDVASHFSNVFSNNNTSLCTGGGTSTSASFMAAPLQEQ